MAYTVYRNEPNELELKGIEIILKSVANKFPFIIGYRFVDDNPLLYQTILSINLIVDVDKLSEFYNFPVDEKFDEYTFLHKGYSFCSPLDYEGSVSDLKCNEDYFRMKKMFNRYHKYLPNKYKIHVRMKSDLTGEEVENDSIVDFDIHFIEFVKNK